METFDKLYNKTLHFLTFRPRSEKEIKDYLKKKKADDLTSVRIIENLKKNKFLDDLEFAKWWVEQRTKIKPRADRIIKFELLQKGIAKEIIDDMIQNSQISELDKALDLAQRKIKRYEKIPREKAYERLSKFLSSKGFDWDTVKQVIEKVLSR